MPNVRPLTNRYIGDYGLVYYKSISESEYLEVDPSTLHLPPSWASGAAPVKLQGQIAT
jgi:hypothetical protein